MGYSIDTDKLNVTSATTMSVATGASIDGYTTSEKVDATTAIQTDHGVITAHDTDLYNFEATSNGDFSFTDKANASIYSFDGSSLNTKVTVHAAATNDKLTSVTTGSGKDFIEFKAKSSASESRTVYLDSGDGDDSISVDTNATGSYSVTANITMGTGKDTLTLTTTNSGSIVANISDYSYSEGDVVIGNDLGSELSWNKTDGISVMSYGLQVQHAHTSVQASMQDTNGVYEIKVGGTTDAVTTYAGTNSSNVEYTASEAVNFYDGYTTSAGALTLNLTKGDNTVSVANTVSGSTFTLNVADSAKATVTLDTKNDLTLGITKKTGEVSISSILDKNDTLYLNDGGKITDLKIDSSDKQKLIYGEATVAKALDVAGNQGKFNYSNGTENGVVAYGGTTGVDYASDVTYYTRATTLLVDDTIHDAVINLNGETGVQYASSISVVSGVTGGLVAGRTGSATQFNIKTEEGQTTQVRGGANANDTINLGTEEDATNKVWYSIGDGKDEVTKFNYGSDSIYFHDAYAQTKLLSEALKVTSGSDATLTLTDSDVLKLSGSKLAGKTLTFTDAEDKVYKVAVSDSTSVDYDADIKIYKASGNSATLNVKGDDYLCIYTGGNNDEYGYYDSKIKAISAADATGTLQLSGTNVAGFTITGGKGINHLYGGGDKSQTLKGTDSAVDVFWFGSGDGNDTATNAEATDGLNLYNVENIDDVKVTVGSNYFTVNVGSDNLKVTTTGTTTAASVLKGFTFANQAGTLYTYDTTTKSFQQK